MAASASDKPPLLITQNFDGLSFSALDALASRMGPADLKLARERIIEMHGSINRTVCLQCRHVRHSLDAALSPALSGITESNMGESVIPVEQLPRCGGPQWNGSNRFGRCGGLLRPAIVWFGEVPEGMGEIAKELNWTDLLIIVGTSLLVSNGGGCSGSYNSQSNRCILLRDSPGRSRNAVGRSPFSIWIPLWQMNTQIFYFWDPARSPYRRH